MGVSTRLYQDWEGGVRPIPLHRPDSLAEALGLGPARRDDLWFIAGGGFPPRGPSRPDPEAAPGRTTPGRGLRRQVASGRAVRRGTGASTEEGTTSSVSSSITETRTTGLGAVSRLWVRSSAKSTLTG